MENWDTMLSDGINYHMGIDGTQEQMPLLMRLHLVLD
jgi:hypothetical protein